jgi:Uma2 family endonuclease
MSTVERPVEPLRAGQRLTRKEFLRRWEAMPELKFAELIDGVVYIPSPQTSDHGRAQFEVGAWLANYVASTTGCDGGSQSTWLMLQSAPQPDIYLWILPEYCFVPRDLAWEVVQEFLCTQQPSPAVKWVTTFELEALGIDWNEPE